MFGRCFTSNPDLVFKIEQNLKFTPFNVEDFIYSQTPKGYTDYIFSDEYLGSLNVLTQLCFDERIHLFFYTFPSQFLHTYQSSIDCIYVIYTEYASVRKRKRREAEPSSYRAFVSTEFFNRVQDAIHTYTDYSSCFAICSSGKHANIRFFSNSLQVCQHVFPRIRLV